MSLNNQGINLKPMYLCGKCAFLYKPKEGCLLSLIPSYIPVVENIVKIPMMYFYYETSTK